jgi:hypothetical protein
MKHCIVCDAPVPEGTVHECALTKLFLSDPSTASHHLSIAMFNAEMKRQQRAFEKQKEASQ